MLFKKKKRTKKILERKSPDEAVIEIGYMLTIEIMKNPNSLSHEEFTVGLITTLEGEINSGGFESFFWNQYGNYTNESIKALEEIGSSNELRILTQAALAFPDGKVPKDINERQNFMDQNEDYLEEYWAPLDQEFWTSKENTIDMLFEYIHENIEQFR